VVLGQRDDVSPRRPDPAGAKLGHSHLPAAGQESDPGVPLAQEIADLRADAIDHDHLGGDAVPLPGQGLEAALEVPPAADGSHDH